MADFEQFSRFIIELCAYFERKHPSPLTLDQWWEELKHIQPDYYPGIAKALKEYDTWPKNFPQKVLEIFSRTGHPATNQEHPAVWSPWKYAEKECKTCEGKGFTKQEKTVFSKDGERSVRLKARVLCPCVERHIYAF